MQQQCNINVFLSSLNTNNTTTVVLPPIKCQFDAESPSSYNNTTRRGRKSHGHYTAAKKKIIAQWLFFNESLWIPLDLVNHEKLENTIRTKGTFIDIQDSHFPEVRRVRVFPELDYLSYLGVRYKISKVLLPN